MNKAPFHIHLDLVGGIAGDMFLSAITDARPELVEGLMSTFHGLAPAVRSRSAFNGSGARRQVEPGGRVRVD